MSVEAQRDKLHADADVAYADDVEWLEGSAPGLSEREVILTRQAFQEGYAEGERRGYRLGGQDALRAATTLSTLMSNPVWEKTLETLRFFAGLDR